MMKSAALLALAAPLAAADHLANYTLTGADIANFALQLECLEAEFYSYAAGMGGLSDELRGGGPKPMGGKKANLTALGTEGTVYGAKGLAMELAKDEMDHVRVLRAALGDAAVACPQINIGSAFQAAASAALNKTADPAFDPYANDLFFLHGAFIFEDVGVTAYNGAAYAASKTLPMPVFNAVASILPVEAYHGGAIRTLLAVANAMGVQTPYASVAGTVQAIVNLINSADGLNAGVPMNMTDKAQGIVMDGKLNIVPTNDMGLAFSRNVAEVLNVVFLGNETQGGFFPEGFNGVFGELDRATLLVKLTEFGNSLANMSECDMGMSPEMAMSPEKMSPEMAMSPEMGMSPEMAMSPEMNNGGCMDVYGQCGGEMWKGSTCCVAGSECKASNKYYSQCLPKKSTNGVQLYMQCGGRDYKGSTKCVDGAVCKKINKYYSQCSPNKSVM